MWLIRLAAVSAVGVSSLEVSNASIGSGLIIRLRAAGRPGRGRKKLNSYTVTAAGHSGSANLPCRPAATTTECTPRGGQNMHSVQDSLPVSARPRFAAVLYCHLYYYSSTLASLPSPRGAAPWAASALQFSQKYRQRQQFPLPVMSGSDSVIRTVSVLKRDGAEIAALRIR